MAVWQGAECGIKVKKDQMSPKLKTALLSLASIVLGLLALEGAARLIAPLPGYGLPKNLFARDGAMWILSPGFSGVMDNTVDYQNKVVTVNGRGARSTPEAEGLYSARRLTILGDSQTFGHGLSDQETWPNLLQKAIKAQGKAIVVENRGVPAINVDQYVPHLDHVLKTAHPGDAVLLGISWNDLTTPQDNAMATDVVEGYIVNLPSQADDDARQAVVERVRRYDQTGIALPPLNDLRVMASFLSERSALAALAYRAAQSIYYRFRSSHPVVTLLERDVATVNMGQIGVMNARAAEKGVNLSVIFLPDRILFDDAAFAAFSQNGRFFPDQDVMGQVGGALCADLGLTCLNAFSTLHEHQNEGLAFPIDGHYNERGAALIHAFLV